MGKHSAVENKKRKQSSDEDSDDSELSVKQPRSRTSSKNSENNSPKKLKRKLSSDEESSDDDDGIPIKAKVELLPPSLVLEHIEKMTVSLGDKNPSAKKAINNYTEGVEGVDQKLLQLSMNRYLHLSMQPQKLDVSTGSKLMQDFLSSPNALKFFPGFPRKPKAVVYCYAAMKGIENSLTMLKEANARMKEDDSGRRKAEKESANLRVKYLEELREFAEKNDAILSVKQSKFLHTTILRLDRQLDPAKYERERQEKQEQREKKKAEIAAKKGSGSGRKKRMSKEPMSAFDYFVSLSANLYTDLEPEKRLKKLQKKFNKLDDNVRDVYEKLAIRDT